MTEEEKERCAARFAVHVGVDRAGFEAAHANLQDAFPDVAPSQMLLGMEFAGHHGFTFARDLHRRG